MVAMVPDIRLMLAVLLAVLAAALPASGQDGEVEEKGRLLLEDNCAACHAIGRTGDSQHREAPAFRVLGQRYPVETLEEALGEGLMSGHPDMPEFQFEPEEVGAIIAYLKAIQVPSSQ